MWDPARLAPRLAERDLGGGRGPRVENRQNRLWAGDHAYNVRIFTSSRRWAQVMTL